jgi:DNA-binding protein YbaB
VPAPTSSQRAGASRTWQLGLTLVWRKGFEVNNDAADHDVAHVLSLVQEQMRDLSVMQQKRSELTAKGTAADGTVEVTVDAQRMVTKAVIDESYLDEFELADLGGYITTAAQQAAREIEQRAAALLAPLTKRRTEISSLSGLVADVPDFHDLITGLTSPAPGAGEARGADERDDGTQESSHYPTVRR